MIDEYYITRPQFTTSHSYGVLPTYRARVIPSFTIRMDVTTLYLFDYNKYYKSVQNIRECVIVESLYDRNSSFIVLNSPYLNVYENGIKKKTADVVLMLMNGSCNNINDNILLVNVFVPFNKDALLKLKRCVDFATDVYTMFVPVFKSSNVVCFIIKRIMPDNLMLSFLHHKLLNIFPDKSYRIVRINHIYLYNKYLFT